MCVCVCVFEGWVGGEEGREGVQISADAPFCVIKRKCDKDRNRARRPQAAHYPSTTITRNPSADECPLTEPLI